MAQTPSLRPKFEVSLQIKTESAIYFYVACFCLISEKAFSRFRCKILFLA